MTCRFLDSSDGSSHIRFSISTKFCCRHAHTGNMQPLVTFITVKHLVLTASEFSDFKKTDILAKFNCGDFSDYCHFKVSKGAKIRNRYNEVPHLTEDTNGKVTNSHLDTTNESQEVSPFPAGDHKAHINRRAQTQERKKHKVIFYSH